MTDYAANLALFLTERTGSCLSTWKGRLTAAEQRALFGRYMGKGTLYIDGTAETVEHWAKSCFGLDGDCTASFKWVSPTTPSAADFSAALGPCNK